MIECKKELQNTFCRKLYFDIYNGLKKNNVGQEMSWILYMQTTPHTRG